MTAVRPYRQTDEEAIRRICCDTALYGKPIDPLLSDRQLVADSLVSYYTLLEPESTFVAEENGRVVGYINGCLDTHRYERLFSRQIAPKLARRVVVGGHWCRWKFWRLVFLFWQSESRWAKARQSAASAYPAHCHMNLDAGFRQTGTGSALFKTFLARLNTHQIPGIHIVTATEGGKGFFAKMGFRPLLKYPSPSLPGISSREVWVMGLKIQS